MILKINHVSDAEFVVLWDSRIPGGRPELRGLAYGTILSRQPGTP